MAVTYGFYNSLDGDRKYGAIDFSRIFNGIIRDGVFMSVGDKLMVTETEGMDISVGIGRAWFDGTWTMNDAILPLTIDESDIVLNRIDAVVLETNKDDSVRANSIKIVKGTLATTPVRPTMIRSELVNQYPLAFVFVEKLTEEITQANITNMVGKSETPFVTGILETMDIDALIAQWGTQWDEWTDQQADDFVQWMNGQMVDYDIWSQDRRNEFDAWFDQFKDVIDESAAMTITALLNDHKYDRTGHIYYGLAVGENDKTLVLPTDPAYPITYIDGFAISFKNDEENTGLTTIDINGLGPKDLLLSNGKPVPVRYLKENSVYTARYNGTSFILQGEGGDDGSKNAKYGNGVGQITTFELFMHGFDPSYNGGGY